MKLTDPNIIKDGEKDLINAIEDDLDLDSINEIIKDKLKVKNLKSIDPSQTNLPRQLFNY